MSDGNVVDLTGKKVLLTGAGGRLGRNMALQLARAGADLALHYNTSSKPAEEVADAIRPMGRRASTIKSTLTTVERCDELVGTAVNNLGGLDVLINNAAVIVPNRYSPEDWTDEAWEISMSVNVKAPVHLALAARPHLEMTHGVILNISSGAALRGMGPYACSKAALNAATRFLAQKFAPKVRVNGIAFGPIETGVDSHEETKQRVREGLSEDERDSVVPYGDPFLRRRGTAWEAAGTVVFFASDQAGYFTGETVLMGGGNFFRA